MKRYAKALGFVLVTSMVIVPLIIMKGLDFMERLGGGSALGILSLRGLGYVYPLFAFPALLAGLTYFASLIFIRQISDPLIFSKSHWVVGAISGVLATCVPIWSIYMELNSSRLSFEPEGFIYIAFVFAIPGAILGALLSRTTLRVLKAEAGEKA